MEDLIKQFYPQAIESEKYARQIVGTLKAEYGFIPERTILAESVCSDEIVEVSADFCSLLALKRPFQLGGLAGFPFTGTTGLAAFSGHVPDEGYAMIVYGPHIGITKQGEIGTVKRMGQHKETTCCGALAALVNALKKNRAGSGDKTLDYQQRTLEMRLVNDSDEILESDYPLMAATDQIYKQTDRRIKQLLELGADGFENKSVALIGGTVINTDFNHSDWFVPKEFSVHNF